MHTLIIVFEIIVAIKILNTQRIKLLTIEVENKLIELNNKLQKAAVEGDVEVDKSYQYLNSILSNSRHTIRYINIWMVLSNAFNKEKFSFILTEHANEVNEIRKNKILANLYEDFNSVSFKFLISRSIFSLLAIIVPFYFMVYVIRFCKNLSLKGYFRSQQKTLRHILIISETYPENVKIFKNSSLKSDSIGTYLQN